jgi:hypothetical protein
MLEHALAALFEEQASESPPSPQASLPAAVRQGRIRLRRHRTVNVLAPVLAVAAVLAIAVTGVLAGPTPVPPAQRGVPGPTPAKVLPLRVAFGWLPAGFSPYSAYVDADESGIFATRPGEKVAVVVKVSAYRRGVCEIQPSKLVCDDKGTSTWPLAGSAPDVRGRSAYWASYAGEVFQYAPGSWAVVSAGTHATDAAVALHLRVGSVVRPVRYLTQLTGSWPGLGMEYATGLYVGTVLTGTQWELGGPGYQVRSSPPGPHGPIEIDVYKPTRGFCTTSPPGTPAIINGYRVTTWKSAAGDLHGVPFQAATTLCAALDGKDIQITVTGTNRGVTATSIFAHMKLFGSDPADWTTKPIG